VPRKGTDEPAWYGPSGPLHKNEWLYNAGGVIEARVSRWSIECRQAVEVTRFDEGAEASAHWELTAAVSWMEMGMGRPDANKGRRAPPSPRGSALAQGQRNRGRADRNERKREPSANDKDGADAQPRGNIRAVSVAKRVTTWMPEETEYGRIARLLVSDPRKGIDEWKRRESGTLLSATAAGARYESEWTNYPPPPETRGSKSRNQQPTLADLLTNRQVRTPSLPLQGRLVLEFTTSDVSKGNVTGNVYDPENPAKKHSVFGKANFESDAHKSVLRLTSRGLPRRTKPSSPVFPDTAYTLVLTYDGQNFVGHAEQANLPNEVIRGKVNLKFVPAEAETAE
jgi:hypothetical protein